MKPLLLAILLAQAVETIEVRVTNVDVVVTDRTGKPVRGLTRDDFELYENGRLQPISNFYAIDSQTSNIDAEAPRDLRKRRVVIFIDNDSIDPQVRSRFVDALQPRIASLLQPGDEASLVVWSRGSKRVAPFTRDATKLAELLGNERKRASNGVGGMGRAAMERQVFDLLDMVRRRIISVDDAYQQALQAARLWQQELENAERHLMAGMSTVVASLAGVEGKKVMIFASGGIPQAQAADMFAWVDRQFRGSMRFGSSFITTEQQLTKKNDSLFSIGRQANANGVTLYLVDLSATQLQMAERMNAGQSVSAGVFDSVNESASFSQLAEITGGTTVSGTTNFDKAIEALAADLDTYYSLGYRSGDDARERKVVVKVKRPGLTARARQTWIPKTTREQIEERVIANLYDATAANELTVDVKADKPVKKERNLFNVPVRITLDPTGLTLLPDGDALAGGFAIYLAVGNAKGELSRVTKIDRPIRIAPAGEAKLRATPMTYDADVMMRGGERTLSIAVVDSLTNATGFARVTVNAR